MGGMVSFYKRVGVLKNLIYLSKIIDIQTFTLQSLARVH
jgi:hypothetical protein